MASCDRCACRSRFAPLTGWRTWSPPPGHITEVLYAWVWMPLVALTSVSPLAPYSKRQTEGHFAERLRTGLVIQHGPERASAWSIVSTIRLAAPARTSPGGRRRLELSTPRGHARVVLRHSLCLRNYPEDALMPSTTARQPHAQWVARMTKRPAPTGAGKSALSEGSASGASDRRGRRIVASSEQDKQLRAELAQGLGYFPASLSPRTLPGIANRSLSARPERKPDGWGPGGYKWRQWDHLNEERRRTEIEAQGRASVADLYEWAVMSTSDDLLLRLA